MNYIFLVLAFVLNSTGNIFFKIAGDKGINFQIFPLTDFVKSNIYLFSGLFFFVLNAVLKKIFPVEFKTNARIKKM